MAWFQGEETDPGFNDFGFFSVSGPGTNLATLVGSIGSVGGIHNGTGWMNESFIAPSAGNYNVGFGTLNQNDNQSPSTLLVDAVPEPSSFALAGLGVVALWVAGRRKSPLSAFVRTRN